MGAAEVVGYCMVAFGLGYSGGALIRVVRKAIESLD